MRLALTVEYEGTNYHGFQYQVNTPTIQEELEKAITRMTGHHSRVKGAGRTDAGVHALAQVVAFDTLSERDPDVLVGALNHYLPADIAVKGAYTVAAGFDPRRWALSRTYRYTILNSQVPSPLMRRTAMLVPQSLNVQKMNRAASFLVGQHDFANFSSPLDDRGASTVRQIKQASVARAGDLVFFEVRANAFLPRQVRRMAGALLDIGRDRLKMNELKQMIGRASDSLPRADSLQASGLCLMGIEYAGFPPQIGKNYGI